MTLIIRRAQVRVLAGPLEKPCYGGAFRIEGTPAGPGEGHGEGHTTYAIWQ